MQTKYRSYTLPVKISDIPAHKRVFFSIYVLCVYVCFKTIFYYFKIITEYIKTI